MHYDILVIFFIWVSILLNSLVLCHNGVFFFCPSTLNGSYTDKQFCVALSSSWKNLKF